MNNKIILSAFLIVLSLTQTSTGADLKTIQFVSSHTSSKLNGNKSLGNKTVFLNGLKIGQVGETLTLTGRENSFVVKSLHAHYVEIKLGFETDGSLKVIGEPDVKRGDPCLSSTPVYIYQKKGWQGYEALKQESAVIVLGEVSLKKTEFSCSSPPSGIAGLIYKKFVFNINSNVEKADVFLQGGKLSNFDLSKKLSASIHQYSSNITVVLKNQAMKIVASSWI